MNNAKIINILQKMKDEEMEKLIEEVSQNEYTHGDKAEALNFAIFIIKESEKNKEE